MGQKKREGIEKEKSIVMVDTKAIESKVDNAVKEATRVIKTDEDLAEATKVITNVKLLQKFVKQEKDKLLKPALETTKAIRGLFAPMEEKIDEAERVLRINMGAYHDKREAERIKKEEALAARVEKGQLKEETAVRKMEELPEVKTSVRNEQGRATFSKIRKVRFADAKTLTAEQVHFLVGQGYLIWDEAIARKAALAGFLEIGVEIYEETSVATTV